jgi:hypothetical protein
VAQGYQPQPQGYPQPGGGYPQQPGAQQGYVFSDLYNQADHSGIKLLEKGDYDAVVESAEWGRTKGGDKGQWTIITRTTTGPDANTKLTGYITVSVDNPKSLGMMFRHVSALTGLPLPDPSNAQAQAEWGRGEEHLATLMRGRPVLVFVVQDEWEGVTRNKIKDWKPARPGAPTSVQQPQQAAPAMGGYQPGQVAQGYAPPAQQPQGYPPQAAPGQPPWQPQQPAQPPWTPQMAEQQGQAAVQQMAQQGSPLAQAAQQPNPAAPAYAQPAQPGQPGTGQFTPQGQAVQPGTISGQAAAVPPWNQQPQQPNGQQPQAEQQPAPQGGGTPPQPPWAGG